MSRAEWERFAGELPLNEVKEKILTGYLEDPRAWDASGCDHLRDFEQLDFGSVLDFGCGLGRNFPSLKAIFDHVDGYDLPPMIERLESDEPALASSVRLISSDWAAIKERRYDLVVATLVFQHVFERELITYLGDIAAMSPYLWVETRSWNDDRRKSNLEIIRDTGLYEVKHLGLEAGGSGSIDEFIGRDSEVHCAMLLESKRFKAGEPPATGTRETILDPASAPFDDSDLVNNIHRANFSHDLNVTRDTLPTGGRFRALLARKFKRALDWYLEPALQGQREFNAHVTRALNDIKRYLDHLREAGESLSAEVRLLNERLERLTGEHDDGPARFGERDDDGSPPDASVPSRKSGDAPRASKRRSGKARD